METSVRLLKQDSKILKRSKSTLYESCQRIKSVSKFESQNKEQKMKTERLEAQYRRDNLRFYGFDEKSDDKSDESWEETTVRNHIDGHVDIDVASIQIERAHRVRGLKISTTHNSEVLTQ